MERARPARAARAWSTAGATSTTRAARLGLPPLERVHGGISERLCLVGTFPQLEYPRDWPDWTHVVGPLLWEPPYEDVEPPPGDEPLVLVAPSTAQDRSHRLLRAALAGLDGEPVRVLATWNRRPLAGPLRVPANARLVEWISYARTMPRCAVVVCHVGHGTMVRALASGAAVVACPVAGDMAENAARLDWAGAGVRLPWRFATPRGVRLAVRRALADAGGRRGAPASWRRGRARTTAPSGRPSWSRSWRGVAERAALSCRCCTSERLTLRPLTEARPRPRSSAILADPSVRRWWGTVDGPEALREDLRHDGSAFAIEVDGVVAGWLGSARRRARLPPRRARHRARARRTRTAGSARRRCAPSIRWLIDERGHHRFTIDPAVANERAIRAYAAVGFRAGRRACAATSAARTGRWRGRAADGPAGGGAAR